MSLRYSTIHDWGRQRANPDYDLFDRSLDMRIR